MANIKKNFNFRNGVQVDDDNLLVTATGLVGIGTTVPTEALDVRGNVKIVGDATITNATVGVLTITNVVPTQIIGAGVSIVSGIVTAQGSGIVTFYGDARYLQGMPTSQWVDTNAGFAVSSIYNQGSTVGIATTNPKSTLQIGDNPDPIGGVSGRGVGISSAGNINASGIISATTFSGNLVGDITGNVTGIVTGNINSNLATITQINATNLNVSGLSTFAGITSVTGPILHSNQLDVSGISTMRGGVHVPASGGGDQLQIGFVKNNLIDVTGIASIGTRFSTQDLHLSGGGVNPDPNRGVKVHSDLYLLKQLDVTGASTFRQPMSIQGAGQVDLSTSGSITASGLVRTTSQVKGDDGLLTTDIQIGQATIPGVIGHPRLIRTSNNGPLLLAGYQNSGVIIQDVFTCNGNLQADANIIANSSSGKIGVGTDNPANDIQIRKSGNTELQVTSDTGIAGLTLGREPSTGNTNNAEFRYGGGAGASYSSAQSLDIINYGTGNFNYHISAANPNGAVGDFHWHKGFNSARLMTLTNTGRLGIGVTNPTETLTVSGVSTVTSNSFVGGNFNVSGNTVIGGNLTLSGSLGVSAISADITGNVTGNLTGNVNSTTGISSFRRIGINTDIPFSSLDLDCFEGEAGFQRVGIGSTVPNAILDVGGDLSDPSKKMIILPRVSAASTSLVQADQPEGGGLIYNTTLRKLQFHNGTNWETVTSVEVTG